ncbi:hypothetical protein AZH53_04220 [Methanomicrobiaceae archaeon CYW5]|nr:hypothetical protein [Methanovulcanius yangii]
MVGAISLLYVDDEPTLLDITKIFLERTGKFTVDTAVSAEDGIRMILEGEYDAVVSDYQMPGMNGIEFLQALRAAGNTIPFFIFTGRGREEVVIEAMNAGVDYYVQKGGNPHVQYSELRNVICRAVEKRRTEMRLLEHERWMADVINFLPDATFAIDTRGRVIAWNRAMEEMSGISASQILGRGNYEYALPFYGHRRPILIDLVLHKDLCKEVVYPVLNCEDKRKIFGEVFLPHLRGKDGAHLWFTASPLYDAEGGITGAIESIRDIREYKRAEGLYKTVFENTGTAMMVLEEDVSISYVNEKMKKLFSDISDDADVLEKWLSFFVEEDREKMLEYHRLRREDSDSAPGSYECRLIRKDGEIRTLSLTLAMIPGTRKSIVSVIDITPQREAERKLRFTRFSTDNAPDAIVWADPKGRIFSANRSACETFGYPEEELLTMSISDFAPDMPPGRFTEFWDIAREKGSFTFEARVTKKDGQDVLIELSIVFLDFDGQEYECGFARDISRRKKFEETLLESETKYREIFNATDEIIFLSGFIPERGPGSIIDANDAFCDLVEYTREELIGMSISDIEPPLSDEMMANIFDQFRTKGRATFETEAVRRDGTRVPVENNITTFMLNDQQVILTVGRNISERRASEKALRVMNKKLNLLSSITRHDIRNRLSVLMGYEELLREEIGSGKAVEYLRQVMEATEMIQDQITFTGEYQELGVKTPGWQPVELVAKTVLSRLPDNNLQITIDAGRLEIFADPMLSKVFYNIFENTIRYGGHVTGITLSFSERDDMGVLVIEDDGVGISDDKKEKIFERGYGANTGFGLFLTREILDITGISISETGTEGKGARFEIPIPKGGYRFR